MCNAQNESDVKEKWAKAAAEATTTDVIAVVVATTATNGRET